MINPDALKVFSQIANFSEHFLQVTIDKSGNIVSSSSRIGPIPSLFENKNTPISFSDCFLASDWSNYENQRIKAQNDDQQSFLVELQKINYPDQSFILYKWEFFFLTKDFGTCLGIGHPLLDNQPYDMGIGDFFDSNKSNSKLINSILEDKVLGFWEFDYNKTKNTISQGLAQMFGYGKNEWSEEAEIIWEKLIYPEDFKELMGKLSSHFKSNGSLPFKAEFRIVSKSQQTRWIYCFGKTIQWNKIDNPTKILGYLLDITTHKKRELWMNEHQHFLKELTFNQSHSLRARIANISGLLEILDLEQNQAESKRLIQVIKEEAKQLDNTLKKSIKDAVKQDESLKKSSSQD